MTVLLGRQSAGASGDFSASGHTAAWPFVAVASGDLVNLFAQTQVGTNGSSTGWRLGIYANSAGLPGARLGVANVTVGTPTGSGVFGAVLGTSVAIVSGTTYWLAWYAVDASDSHIDFTGTAAGSYRESNAAADFPDPFGASSGSTVDAIIWGESLAAPIPGVVADPDWSRFPKHVLART